ncbi:urease accessory protein UreD [Parendozoicomonas sp. Alg238-R29]|uniref:urease accessory protein UreD n=1 Tax=Parendozoicomonas sp. Alg238-R29 TaxID=2993446 RepID=UPI00248E69E0|nr:urease accessory protein UreD [Parendozoicomonas sp. Alg238-R29]
MTVALSSPDVSSHFLRGKPKEDPHQFWQAGLEVELRASDQKTILGRTRHYGPLRLQRPFFPEGRDLAHLYILHPPGGLVAGDRLQQSITVQPGAAGVVTTPAAGKVYFSQSGSQQKQIIELKVGNDASLEWLPQETILYNGCAAAMETRVTLTGTARYIGWEIICLGRTASGEHFNQGSLLQTVRLERDGKPLFQERMHLEAGEYKQSGLLGFHGRPVFGTMMATLDKEPDIEEWHSQLNQDADHPIALTSRNGVLLVRYLGYSSAKARALFEQAWQLCRPQVLGREACRPRIWNT